MWSADVRSEAPRAALSPRAGEPDRGLPCPVDFDPPLKALSRVGIAAAAGGTAAAVAVSLWAYPGWEGFGGAALAVLMASIALVDARRFIIPDPLVAAALALGLADAALVSPTALDDVAGALLRGCAAAVAFAALRAFYARWRGREGMGFGDVKLAAVAGVWLGWFALFLAIELAALAALVVISWRLVRGRVTTWTTALPFGAYFAPAIWAAWLFEALLQLR